MVEEHRGAYPSEWAAISSIAAKVGCTLETLRNWCREEASRRAGPAAQAVSELDRVKALEREVKELHRANEILRNASAYFAQAELDISVIGVGRVQRFAQNLLRVARFDADRRHTF